MPDKPMLGTLLRHLVELLDGAVEQAYLRAGLTYRPRYTPVMRALLALGPASIRTISLHARTTHSATSQTVAQMAKDGVVQSRPGEDARERIIALTPRARRLLPALERQWAVIDAAARRLEGELSVPLSAVVAEALEALAREGFAERIERAAAEQRAKPRGTPSALKPR
jgi:DNA-binding MarR family transcriptional regulator